MKYSKLIAAVTAACAAAVLLSACTDGNDQVATLPLTNEEMPVEIMTEETTTVETTESTAEETADAEN